MGNYITRSFLYFAQGGKCHYCNVRMNLKDGGKDLCTRDHIIPKVKGGSNHRTNLVGACVTCNNLKGQVPYWAFKAYITLYGRDRRMKDVLRELTRDKYEQQKKMWDAIQGSPSFEDEPSPIIHADIVALRVMPYKPRRAILHVTRRNIDDIVSKTPFWERNRIWGKHLKQEETSETRTENAEAGIQAGEGRGWPLHLAERVPIDPAFCNQPHAGNGVVGGDLPPHPS